MAARRPGGPTAGARLQTGGPDLGARSPWSQPRTGTVGEGAPPAPGTRPREAPRVQAGKQVWGKWGPVLVGPAGAGEGDAAAEGLGSSGSPGRASRAAAARLSTGHLEAPSEELRPPRRRPFPGSPGLRLPRALGGRKIYWGECVCVCKKILPTQYV